MEMPFAKVENKMQKVDRSLPRPANVLHHFFHRSLYKMHSSPFLVLERHTNAHYRPNSYIYAAGRRTMAAGHVADHACGGVAQSLQKQLLELAEKN